MELFKQGMTADEIHYRDAKRDASDEGYRRKMNAYRNRQMVANLNVILPEHVKQDIIERG